MKLTMRSLVYGYLAALTTLAGMPWNAYAQQFPTHELRLICVYPPGSGADVVVRYFADKLRPHTGKAIIVENRPGANGNLALEYMARAKPDGHTIFLHGVTGVAVSMSTLIKAPVDVASAIRLAGTTHRRRPLA
jgi:tripartite-type tricarboxylate transporter receptor subunit TctC